MQNQRTESEQNLLKLSSQWQDLPVDIQLEVAGRVIGKIINKMSRPKKTFITFVVTGGLAAILTLLVIELGNLQAQTLVFGAWMFLLGALFVLLVTILTNRR